MTEHDEAILKAAEAVHARLASIKGSLPFHEDPTVKALFSAVAAKREAQRPKLLSAMEATRVFQLASGFSVGTTGLQAVLDACLSRAEKVLLHEISAFYDSKSIVTDADAVRGRIETIIRTVLTSARGDQS